MHHHSQSITTLFMHPVIYIKHKSTHIINHNRQIIKILYSKSIPLPYLQHIQTYIQWYTAKQQRILCSLLYIDYIITLAIQCLEKRINEKQYQTYVVIKISTFILHMQHYYTEHSHVIIKINYSAYSYMFNSWTDSNQQPCHREYQR